MKVRLGGQHVWLGTNAKIIYEGTEIPILYKFEDRSLHYTSA